MNLKKVLKVFCFTMAITSLFATKTFCHWSQDNFLKGNFNNQNSFDYTLYTLYSSLLNFDHVSYEKYMDHFNKLLVSTKESYAENVGTPPVNIGTMQSPNIVICTYNIQAKDILPKANDCVYMDLDLDGYFELYVTDENAKIIINRQYGPNYVDEYGRTFDNGTLAKKDGVMLKVDMNTGLVAQGSGSSMGSIGSGNSSNSSRGSNSSSNTNSNHMYIDLGYGLSYDGPRIVTDDVFNRGSVELVAMKVQEVNMFGYKVVWRVKAHTNGQTQIGYTMKGYDVDGFQVSFGPGLVKKGATEDSFLWTFPEGTVRISMEAN
ncbi:MAG: hypothetical protein IJ593_00540 [Lachnospiraceae bacterium]|nr:hypothetical protein [Lachnospiraceae bacterium]